jgi:hypothetical protein
MKVKEQKADQRFQGMGHNRRAQKNTKQDKRLCAIGCYLSGGLGAPIDKP